MEAHLLFYSLLRLKNNKSSNHKVHLDSLKCKQNLKLIFKSKYKLFLITQRTVIKIKHSQCVSTKFNIKQKKNQIILKF